MDLDVVLEFVKTKSSSKTAKKFDMEFNQFKRIISRAEKQLNLEICSKVEGKIVPSAAILAKEIKLTEIVASFDRLLTINQKMNVYLPIFVMHAFVKFKLKNINYGRLNLSTYSQALMRDYGILAKQIFHEYDIIYLNQEHEYLLDPNLWVSKFKFECPTGIFSTRDYLDSTGGISTPEDIRAHRCLTFSNVHENFWGFVDSKNEPFKVKVNPGVIIDNTLMQAICLNQHIGIAKLELPIASYFNSSGNLVQILDQYQLEPSKWGIYMKADCQHHDREQLINSIIDIAENWKEIFA